MTTYRCTRCGYTTEDWESAAWHHQMPHHEIVSAPVPWPKGPEPTQEMRDDAAYTLGTVTDDEITLTDVRAVHLAKPFACRLFARVPDGRGFFIDTTVTAALLADKAAFDAVVRGTLLAYARRLLAEDAER